MSYFVYSLILKIGFFGVLISSVFVIIHAIRSAKEMGGTLGSGLKKIAAGTIADTILIFTYLLLEQGNKGLLTDDQVRIFFIGVGVFGSLLLLAGYLQVYRITKRLKLFTV